MERAALSPAGSRRGGRAAAALACFVLCGTAFLAYRRARALETPADDFARRLALAARRPSEAGAMRAEPAGDLVAADAVEAMLADASPDERPAPAASPSAPPVRRAPSGDELALARGLMLDAIALRPGWGYHRYLLGRIAYLEGRSVPPGDPRRRPELWADSMRLASTAAPGLATIWITRARATLDDWTELTAEQRAELPSLLSRAFVDPDFLAKNFLPATLIVGRDEAIRLLPADSELLATASGLLSKRGDVAGVAALGPRIEEAQRRERAADVAWIEERSRLGDIENLRYSCVMWIYKHPPSELGDPDAAAQAARVLSLWPADQPGTWENDARAEFVLFFLNGRQSQIKGDLLLSAIEPLAGVPETVRARVHALAGDLAGAQEIAFRNAASDRPRWTSALVEIARAFFRRGRAADGWLALEGVAPSAQGDCNVLLARRDVARALGNRIELATVTRALEGVRQAFSTQQVWSEEGGLTVCLDPEQIGGQLLSVEITATAPAYVTYGWEGTWIGRVLVAPGTTTLRVPLTGQAGRRTLIVRTVAGPPVRPGRAFLEPADSGTKLSTLERNSGGSMPKESARAARDAAAAVAHDMLPRPWKIEEFSGIQSIGSSGRGRGSDVETSRFRDSPRIGSAVSPDLSRTSRNGPGAARPKRAAAVRTTIEPPGRARRTEQEL